MGRKNSKIFGILKNRQNQKIILLQNWWENGVFFIVFPKFHKNSWLIKTDITKVCKKIQVEICNLEVLNNSSKNIFPKNKLVHGLFFNVPKIYFIFFLAPFQWAPGLFPRKYGD